jgi:protein-tyrosine phosphatase
VGFVYRGETSVLFVCHANLCRSPMAERLAELALLQRLAGPVPTRDAAPPPADTGGLVFASAGTHAMAGNPMHRHSVRTLFEYGASRRPFASRQVDGALLTGAGLVLTANRAQRAHCVGLVPATVRRTFTLREFARLCGAVNPAWLPEASPAARMRRLVDAASAARAAFQPTAARDDDVADPVGHDLPAFLACAATMWAALGVLADRLIPAGSATGQAPSPLTGSTTR